MLITVKYAEQISCNLNLIGCKLMMIKYIISKYIQTSILTKVCSHQSLFHVYNIKSNSTKLSVIVYLDQLFSATLCKTFKKALTPCASVSRTDLVIVETEIIDTQPAEAQGLQSKAFVRILTYLNCFWL